MTKTNLGIYLHIPFCQQKCNYCDFNSGCYSIEIQKKYLDSLLSEIKLESNFYKRYSVDSIFIGGGTPSLLPEKYIDKIVKALNKNFNISSNIEFTIEVNPNSINRNKLELYKSLGINRLSIGAQSFVEKELINIGRIHRENDITQGVEDAKSVGFKNISLDLMTAIPLQSMESLKFSLEKAISLGVSHISAYGLIIEDGTPFEKMHKKGKLNLPSEDEERKMYHNLRNFLFENDFVHYEISNFAKPGHESRHNIKYWECEDYLGLGLGAHSRISNTRIENIGDIYKYIQNSENSKSFIEDKVVLTKTDEINEKLIMGIRLIKGINIQSINDEFEIDFLKEYSKEIDNNLKNGYITIEDGYMKLTTRGLDFSNLVELEFYRIEG